MLKNLKICLPVLICICLIFSACSGGNANNSLNSGENPSDKTPVSSDTAVSQTESSSNSSMGLPLQYATILQNIIRAYPFSSDSINPVPQNPELSLMYLNASSLSDIGFALIDLDGNGQKELIIADTKKDFICDVYTADKGKAQHIFSSGEKYYFILRENNLIENHWSESAGVSGTDFFKLSGNKLELIERFTLDAIYALETNRISDAASASAENCVYKSKSDNKKDYIEINNEQFISGIDSYQKSADKLQINFTPIEKYKEYKG